MNKILFNLTIALASFDLCYPMANNHNTWVAIPVHDYVIAHQEIQNRRNMHIQEYASQNNYAEHQAYQDEIRDIYTNIQNFTPMQQGSVIASISSLYTSPNDHFYTQEKEKCLAQLATRKSINAQYQQYHLQEISRLNQLISQQQYLIQNINAKYFEACNQIFAIRTYDLLYNDQELTNIIPTDSSYNILLLLQEFITKNPTKKRKNQILTILNNQFSCRLHDLNHLSAIACDIYEKAWYTRKNHFLAHGHFIATCGKVELFQAQQSLARIRIAHEFVATCNSACDQALSNLEQIDYASIANQHITTENTTTIDQIALVQQEPEKIHACVTESHNADEQIFTTIAQSPLNQAIPTEQAPCINTTIPYQQNASIKKGSIAVTKQLSKKEKAALLAQQRAEQSKIDKEKAAQLKAQQCILPQETKNVLPETPKKIVTTAHKQITASVVKKYSKKNKQETIDEDDFLEQIIAQNKSLHANESNIESENQPVHVGSETVHQYITADQFNTMDDSELFDLFVQWRNSEIDLLPAKKEAQRKENLKKLCKAKAQDRQALKNKLEAELESEFTYIASQEKEIISLLRSYALILQPQNLELMHIKNFLEAQGKILAAEEYLQRELKHLRWYLALDQELYATIKNHIISLKISISQGFLQDHKESDLPSLQLLDQNKKNELFMQYPLLERQIEIAKALEQFHEKGNILDITQLIYKPKTHEELDRLGRLSAETLHSAGQKMKDLYIKNNGTRCDMSMIEPVIQELFQEARIATRHNNVNYIIKGALQVFDKQNSDLENLNISLFNRLQCNNEMVIENFTQDQIADFVKVQMLVIHTFKDIIYN